MHIVLTSSNESKGSISTAWSAMLKRIRRKYPSFEFIKLRTDEGVHGVLHIIARNDSFIEKKWLSENWSDTFQATVTWSTQCFGNVRGLVKYLLGYMEHHASYRLGYSRNWVFCGWIKKFKEIFRKFPFETAKANWHAIVLNTGFTNVASTQGVIDVNVFNDYNGEHGEPI